MDKYDFTLAICRHPEGSNLWCSLGFNHLVYQHDNVQTVAGVLEVGHTYYRFRRCFGIGDLSVESKAYWSELYQKKEALEKVTIRGEDKTFNQNNGTTAFVINRRVYVFNSDKISTSTLKECGFKKDDSLWVPFSNADAFMDDWRVIDPGIA